MWKVSGIAVLAIAFVFAHLGMCILALFWIVEQSLPMWQSFFAIAANLLLAITTSAIITVWAIERLAGIKLFEPSLIPRTNIRRRKD